VLSLIDHFMAPRLQILVRQLEVIMPSRLLQPEERQRGDQIVIAEGSERHDTADTVARASESTIGPTCDHRAVPVAWFIGSVARQRGKVSHPQNAWPAVRP
jgi:hypothetical protein